MKDYVHEKKDLLTSEDVSSGWIIPVSFLIFCLLFLSGIIIVSNVKGNVTKTQESSTSQEKVEEDEDKKREQDNTAKEESNSYLRAEDPNFIATLPEYFVERVVDGDTLIVVKDGHRSRVRLIGVNTPESAKQDAPIECFGLESSEFAKNQLTRKNVRLENDGSQGDIDTYGRFLRYVYIGDRNFNLTLIREGYGKEYTFNNPYKYQEEFRRAESEAKGLSRGLWSPSTCNGN